MKINEFFKEEYLVAGNTYDNWIFENCPQEFLDIAQQSLSNNANDTISCVVTINSDTEKAVQKVLDSCDEEYKKLILARDFVTASIVKQMLKDTNINADAKEIANQQVSAFLASDFNKVKQLHSKSFLPFYVNMLSKPLGKIEVNFILYNLKNKYLQQSINIFVASREPYSVKIFTNNKHLASYYDIMGNIIQNPHDYMSRDVNNFIEKEDGIEKE